MPLSIKLYIFSPIAILLFYFLLLQFSSFETTKHPTFINGDTAKMIISSKLESPSSDLSNLPPFIYGTAWKKERTASLVYLAVKNGFRAIDTACQPKHYNERGVGEGLQKIYEDKICTREELFLQTKFTPINGQEKTSIPYNPTASFHDQVLESFSVSCANLKTDYVDALILHSPLPDFDDMMEVWHTFEEIHRIGGARRLGISNCYDATLLNRLYESASIKPLVLQNRFYKRSGYDTELRSFCAEHGMTYESFWTLTGNPEVLKSSVVKRVAAAHRVSEAEVFFAFVRSLGVTILTGTTSEEHMIKDLASPLLPLTPAELQDIQRLIA